MQQIRTTFWSSEGYFFTSNHISNYTTVITYAEHSLGNPPGAATLLQWCNDADISKICRNLKKYADISKNTQKSQKICRNLKKYAEISKNMQKSQKKGISVGEKWFRLIFTLFFLAKIHYIHLAFVRPKDSYRLL